MEENILHRFKKYLHIPMYLGMERPRGKKTQTNRSKAKHTRNYDMDRKDRGGKDSLKDIGKHKRKEGKVCREKE